MRLPEKNSGFSKRGLAAAGGLFAGRAFLLTLSLLERPGVKFFEQVKVSMVLSDYKSSKF